MNIHRPGQGEINIFIYLFDMEYNGWVSGGRFGQEIIFLYETETWNILRAYFFFPTNSVIIQLAGKLYRFKMSSSSVH